tara:strand:+ start:1110 stop:1523 length:414 start_codon:yes stop_codon:yes gene_type:complete
MFFDRNKRDKIDKTFVKVASLLIHAAKIDEKYTLNEEEIIKQAILKMGADNNKIQEIINEGKAIEENSNQILDFTKEVKSMNEEDKNYIVEILWRIIYSNKEVDVYESNLMRRLAGLLYIDNKTMGDIKEKIKREFS